MATTKKVASVRSLKKKAAPKKSASSVREKTSTVKRATNTPSKTTKKPTAHKAPRTTKKVSRKNVPKKSSGTTGHTTKSIKLKRVKVGKAKAVTNGKKIKIIGAKDAPAKVGTDLALLSIVRFPVNLDTFAIQTARIGGMMIILMGAFFTLLYSQYIWNAPVIANSISGTQMMGLVAGCDSVTMSTLDYDACVLETKEPSPIVPVTEPPITFDITSEEPLSGTIPIYIKVDIAKTVDVLVFKESYTDPISLGPATKVSQGVWVYQWDTKNDEDTFYKVAADVTNAYTTGSPYRDSDGKYLEVVNTVLVPLPVATETTEETVDPTPEADLKLVSKNPVTGTADFKVRVVDAHTVTLIAQHISSGSKNSLGNAVLTSDDEWEYAWDTTTYNDGKYIITTKIRNQYGAYTNGHIELAVENRTVDEEAIDQSDDSIKDISGTVDESFVDDEMKAPEARLQIRDSGTLSGMVDIRVDIRSTRFVELWVVPVGSKVSKIIGLAKQSSADSERWEFRWDTTGTPNAEYRVIARVKNDFGQYESNVANVTIYNKPYIPEPTEKQEQEIKQIKSAQEIEEAFREKYRKESELLNSEKQNNESELEVLSDEKDAVEEFLLKFDTQITDELNRLVTAYRSGNPEAIKRAEDRLDQLKKEINASALEDVKSSELISRINERVTKIADEYKTLSEKAEELITGRVGKDVFKDSDSDGISDYDELTRYKTDPFTADSDGDGYNDGIEVAEGYDPLDSKREVAIVYESPQEKGVIREDILVIESIEAVVPDDSDTDPDGVDAQAVISGKALPNSFVTLYIFSTPIIVTVKTEEDGSWKYRFDKELEDGEHNIYVGLTDNAGRIVAKSQPFTFIKEAQAFSPVDASVVGSVSNEQADDSLLSTYMIYLILSISVVSIGLVLILLGLHLDSRKRRFEGVVSTEEEV